MASFKPISSKLPLLSTTITSCSAPISTAIAASHASSHLSIFSHRSTLLPSAAAAASSSSSSSCTSMSTWTSSSTSRTSSLSSVPLPSPSSSMFHPLSSVPVKLPFSLDMTPTPTPSSSSSSSVAPVDVVNSGGLLPSNLMYDMLHAHLSSSVNVPGTWILDGFPRTADQVDQLVTLPCSSSSSTSSFASSHVTVIELCASDSIARSRIAHRASSSGRDTADNQRADDASHTIVSTRLAKYREQLPGIQAAFAANGLPVHKVDASGDAETTLALCNAVLARATGGATACGETNVVLVGPPGVGKGTVAKQLASLYDATHVSTGDLARATITNKQQQDVAATSTPASDMDKYDMDMAMGDMAVGYA